MQRRRLIVLAAGLPLGAHAAALNESDATAGVREALARGAEAAVASLGRTDGFLGDKRLRIPLPGHLEDAAKLMRALGQGRRVDDLVTAMNRAAEAAVPQARSLLVNAVKTISVEDALRIVGGGDTAVTDFFQRKTRSALGEQFLPIVRQKTEGVALAEKYQRFAAKAQGIGLVDEQDAELPRYVTRKALDGLYWAIGEEEKKIRRDPLGSGSAILKAVFGR